MLLLGDIFPQDVLFDFFSFSFFFLTLKEGAFSFLLHICFSDVLSGSIYLEECPSLKLAEIFMTFKCPAIIIKLGINMENNIRRFLVLPV